MKPIQIAHIEQQKTKIIEHISFLEASCKNGIDGQLLQEKIREIKSVFRYAQLSNQMGYLNTCNEALQTLETDGFSSCKLMMHATIFNLKCHLDYLILKNPS